RSMNALEFAGGFKGLQRMSVDGSDFFHSYAAMRSVTAQVRKNRQPYLVHAKVSLLTHHTSGVRKEFYRSQENLDLHRLNDPLPKLKRKLIDLHVSETDLEEIESIVADAVKKHFEKAVASREPDPTKIEEHIFGRTPVTDE